MIPDLPLRLLFLVSLGLMPACQIEEAEPASSSDAFDAASLWEEVRDGFDLFYAYRDLRGFDADRYLDRVGAIVSQTDNIDDFRKELNRASYAFTDPHLGFGPYTDTDFNIIPTSSDLQVDHHDGDYFVIDVRAGSAAFKAGIRPGWALTQADGQALQPQILSVFQGLIDNPNDVQQDYVATLIANGRRGEDRNLTFLDATGSARAVALANPREQARTVMNSDPITMQWIETDRTKIAWVRINNRLGDNDLILKFDTVMQDIQEADGLILDLRNTPSGGNTEVGRSIMGHFTAEAKPYQMHERPSLQREFTVPRRFVEYVLPRQPYFDPNRTVVLGGYWTGSMGEGLVIGMDAIGVHTVASDMGDLLGAMSNFSFARGAINLSIPTETLFHIDGTPREHFIADTALRSSDSDEKGGDPALEAALSRLTER